MLRLKGLGVKHVTVVEISFLNKANHSALKYLRVLSDIGLTEF